MTAAALVLVAALQGQAAPRQAAPAPTASAAEAAAQETAPSAPALSPAELDALTARVAARLRCLVCRNQSVLESTSELARRMQGVIRERLAAGASPEEVEAYFVERYGEQILLKPPARGIHIAVYLLPPAALLLAALLLRGRIRRWVERGRGVPSAKGGRAPDAGGTGGERSAGSGLAAEDERWLREIVREG